MVADIKLAIIPPHKFTTSSYMYLRDYKPYLNSLSTFPLPNHWLIAMHNIIRVLPRILKAYWSQLAAPIFL